MATKSKNIKDSKFVKVLSVFITIALCVMLVNSALPVLRYCYVFGENAFKVENPTVFDQRQFYSYLQDDIYKMSSVANHQAQLEQYDKEMAAALSEVTNAFKKSQSYYRNYGNNGYTDYSSDDDESVVTTTMYSEYSEAAKDNLSNSDFGVVFTYNIDLNGYGYVNFECPVTLTEEQAEEYFTSKIEEERVQYQNNFDDDYKPEHLQELQNLKFYAVGSDGTKISNVDDVKAFVKNIEKSDCYYYYTSEKNIKQSGLFTNKNFYDSSLPTLYLQVDTSFSGDDDYSALNSEYQENKDIHFKSEIIKSLVCIFALFIMLVILSTLAGHKNGEKVLALIDKVPNDIHFLLSGGLVGGAGGLLIWSVDEYLYEFVNVYRNIKHIDIEKSLFEALIRLLGCVTFLLFAEWLTSVCRQVKAHSGFFKNTVIYKLIKFCKKHAVKIKNLFSYTPENYKLNLALLISGKYLISLMLYSIILINVREYRYFTAFACFMTFLLIVFEAVCIAFAVKYIINLDKIITASHNKTIPDVDYYRLPNSLKTLVDSLTYNKEELDRAVEKAVRDEHLRTELITNVSHDLKTPLTSIISYVDLLKQCDIDDENAKEYITVLDEKGGKLKRLIEDLIEASKVTSGIISVNKVSLNLNELATQAIVEYQQAFVNNNLELIFKGDKKNVTAFADGNKTYRVIENLLSNALKYSAKGSRVYADVYEQGGKSIFEIKNISAEPLDISPDELTERFVRGDKSRNMDGNGLGLSIADSICKAMAGRLELTIDGDLFKAQVILPK